MFSPVTPTHTHTHTFFKHSKISRHHCKGPDSCPQEVWEEVRSIQHRRFRAAEQPRRPHKASSGERQVRSVAISKGYQEVWLGWDAGMGSGVPLQGHRVTAKVMSKKGRLSKMIGDPVRRGKRLQEETHVETETQEDARYRQRQRPEPCV